jgi:hypothetical protein
MSKLNFNEQQISDNERHFAAGENILKKSPATAELFQKFPFPIYFTNL